MEFGRGAGDYMVLLEVCNAEVACAAHEQLQLVLVKDAEQVVGDEFVEPLQEGLDFLPHATRQPELGHRVQVAQFVAVCHRDLGSVWDVFYHLERG